MYIELERGNVLNTYDDDDALRKGEWYPDDTVIDMVSEKLNRRVSSGGVLRIMPPQIQAPDWPGRAARQWNAVMKVWQATGGQTGETDLEKAVRLLRENPVPNPPGDLPASPTTAQVIQQVRDLTDQVQIHNRYLEGYRKILLRVLTFIGRRLHG